LYAAHTWYGKILALVISSSSVILAMMASIAASVMPASSKLRRFRTRAITPIEPMTASHASASMPPGSHPDMRSHEKPASASAAGPRARSSARRSSFGTASS
jgi:hypothetical protein